MRVLVALLLCVSCVFAAPPVVELPTNLVLREGRAGRLVATVKDGPEKAVIRWINPTPDTIDLIASPDGSWAVVVAPVPGTYRLYAYTAAGDVPSEPAVCVVLVGEPSPNPGPDPGPNPGPNPPPTPPVPDDLAKDLTKAFEGTSDPVKKTSAGLLVGLYTKAGILADNTSLTKVSDFDRAVFTASLDVPSTALPEVRTVIRGKVTKILGTDPQAAFNDTRRRQIKELMAAAAKILTTLGE